MIFDKIELLDPEYGTVKKSSKIRKIKFKSLSFRNISNLWKNFRISSLNKKLEKAKKKLVETKVDQHDLEKQAWMSGMTVAEKKIYKRAAAVIRLEEKINYLETGTKVTDDFIASRAIKLKDNMMKNLRFNCGSAYSVPTDSYGKIFETEEVKTSAPITSSQEEEIRKQTAENVQKIMEQMKAEKHKGASVTTEPQTEVTTEATEQVEKPVTISAPSRDEIRKTVDKMFEEHQEDVTEQVERIVVSQEEIHETVEDALNQIDVRKTISEDEVEETVQEELDSIKVTQNESTPAKVNKFINEDGTYRMKREDIDEDFRITRFERPMTLVDIARQKVQEHTVPAVMKQREEQMAEQRKITLERQSAASRPVVSEKTEREIPIVAPERKMSPTEEIKRLSAAVDGVETKEDIQIILANIEDLKAKQEAGRSRAQAVAQAREELEAERNAVIQELLDYRAALREDCDTTASRIEEEQVANDALATEIQTMKDALRRAK